MILKAFFLLYKKITKFLKSWKTLTKHVMLNIFCSKNLFNICCILAVYESIETYMCLLNNQTNYQITSVWLLIIEKQLSSMLTNKFIGHMWKPFFHCCWTRSWWWGYFLCWNLPPGLFSCFATWRRCFVFYKGSFLLHLRKKD